MKSYISLLLSFGALAAAAPQVTLTPLSGPIPPVRSSEVTGPTSHGPYSGTPTVTGALTAPAVAQSIAPGPPNPVTYTNNNGLLQAGYEPIPYQPAGGAGTNGSLPYYHPLSDFDYESLTLALYQEWIELDLFHNGLARFPASEWEAAGLTAEDRFLIEFMADQEVGHATLLSNILGAAVRLGPLIGFDFHTDNVIRPLLSARTTTHSPLSESFSTSARSSLDSVNPVSMASSATWILASQPLCSCSPSPLKLVNNLPSAR